MKLTERAAKFTAHFNLCGTHVISSISAEYFYNFTDYPFFTHCFYDKIIFTVLVIKRRSGILKRITAFCAGFFTIVFCVLGIIFSPTAVVYALNDQSTSASGELSIASGIGIEIPTAERSMPIIGIIMWAVAAVGIIMALIIIFANAGRIEAGVQRKRYRKKKIKKSKYNSYLKK